MSDDTQESADVLPVQSAPALRVLGSLARFTPDHVVPTRLVQQLHDHVVTEWQMQLPLLETFKLAVIDAGRVYLTDLGANTARKLSGAVDGAGQPDDPSLEVLLATNRACFARSYDEDNKVCGACEVRKLCQWNLPSQISEQAFKLQIADDTERERVAAEEAARRRMEKIEQERRSREERRKNAPNLRSLVDRLWASAAEKGNPEAIEKLAEQEGSKAATGR